MPFFPVKYDLNRPDSALLFIVKEGLDRMGSRNSIERFHWFDHQVRAQRFPNASSLMRKFEISRRTAQREIDYMRERLDFPLKYDASRKGFYYTQDAAPLPPIYLTTEELTALVMARNFLGDISGRALGKEIGEISQKLKKVLNRFVGDEKTVDDALSFRVVTHAPAPGEIIKPVLGACLTHRRIRFTYFSPAHNQSDERTVDPYHLLNYMGSWHLIGHCHLREALRDFNLARMRDVQILDEEFVMPFNFNIHEHLSRGFGIYKTEDADDLTDVTIRFSPEKALWAKGRIWHQKQTETSLPDGSLEYIFPVASFTEVKMEIMKHGAGVEVISPAELREMVRTEAEQVCLLYNICPPGQ